MLFYVPENALSSIYVLTACQIKCDRFVPFLENKDGRWNDIECLSWNCVFSSDHLLLGQNYHIHGTLETEVLKSNRLQRT